jgi:hypothetical protein
MLWVEAMLTGVMCPSALYSSHPRLYVVIVWLLFLRLQVNAAVVQASRSGEMCTWSPVIVSSSVGMLTIAHRHSRHQQCRKSGNQGT